MKSKKDFELELLYVGYQPDEIWTTEELTNHFEVIGFCAPYVNVVRKKDQAKGSVQFNHNPRLYFGFKKN